MVIAIALILTVVPVIAALIGYVYARKSESIAERKPDVTLEPKKVCKHTWKDFPKYIDAMYNIDTRSLRVETVKPYVCIHCKERMDKVLDVKNRLGISYEDASDWAENVKKENGVQMTHALVEEQIADMQLVDQEALRIARQLGVFQDDAGNHDKIDRLMKDVKQGHLPPIGG